MSLENLFSTALGKAIYEKAERAISDFNIKDMLKSGVLVGLSGGADSVMLLLFLSEYRRRNFPFKILAVHINHCIRGEEALRDELFSKKIANLSEVEYISKKIDVPTLAKKCRRV